MWQALKSIETRLETATGLNGNESDVRNFLDYNWNVIKLESKSPPILELGGIQIATSRFDFTFNSLQSKIRPSFMFFKANRPHNLSRAIERR